MFGRVSISGSALRSSRHVMGYLILGHEIHQETTGLIVVSLISTLAFSWSASIFVLWKFYFLLRKNRHTNRFFSGYESAGKMIGFALLFLGNVGLYYFSEKSVACMLTFLFLAFYCLCFLLCIQPYTDFGALEFLLSGSLNQTLHVFGLRSPYSWLVIIVCIVIAGIRYGLEPAHPSGQATRDEVGVQDEEGGFTERSREQSVPPTSTKAHRPFQRLPATKDVPSEVTNLSVVSASLKVNTASSENIPPESTTSILPPGLAPKKDVPPEVTNLSVRSASLKVATASSENIPPESTTSILPPGLAATRDVPPEATNLSVVSAPLKVTTASSENIPPESTTSILPPGLIATKDVPPEATNLSVVSAPLKVTTASSENIPSESSTSIPPPGLTATKDVPPELTNLSVVSAPLKVTTASSGYIPPESTTSILPPGLTATRDAPPEVTNLSVVSAPLKVTTASSENIPPESTTSILPPGLTATKDVPPEVTILSVLSAPSKVTTASSENIPPESTTSILPPELSKAREDAIQLHRALKGWGCDAPTIVKILARRSATQRALIRQEYKTKFSADLDNILSIKLKLSRDLKRAVLLWMHDPATRDAILVRQGLTEKLTLKLNVAIEVICSRTPSQIEQLKKAYCPLFGSYLEQDIESHALDDNKKLLLAYVSKSRSEGTKVDATMVNKDANALFKDGEYKLGTNEETFIRIFSERSWAHLAAVNAAYRSMYVNSLRKAVKHETSWNFKCALLTILQCAENPAKYFAKVLHKAMEGLGTDDKTLSRIIVSRAEIDIQQIKAEYLKKYKKSLSDEVHSETSGNYRAFLLSLLDTNN